MTAYLPLRLASFTALSCFRGTLRLAPEGLFRERVARRPYRRLLREAASNAPRSRRIGPLRGRTRLPLTLPVVLAPEERTPPRPRPPSRVDGTGAPGPPSLPSRQGGQLSRSGASSAGCARAYAGFCNRERFTSAVANRTDPPPRGPRLPSRLTERTAWPLSRHCRPDFPAQGSRSWPSPSPTPHQAHLMGLPQYRVARALLSPVRGGAGWRSHPRRACSRRCLDERARALLAQAAPDGMIALATTRR